MPLELGEPVCAPGSPPGGGGEEAGSTLLSAGPCAWQRLSERLILILRSQKCFKPRSKEETAAVSLEGHPPLSRQDPMGETWAPGLKLRAKQA